MPTVSAGSGASLTDIYYEVRGDTASSSGRCKCVHTLATRSQGFQSDDNLEIVTKKHATTGKVTSILLSAF